MTLPLEQLNAIRFARLFLLSLLDPKSTPRVPKEIRRKARSVLKHFPNSITCDLIEAICSCGIFYDETKFSKKRKK